MTVPNRNLYEKLKGDNGGPSAHAQFAKGDPFLSKSEKKVRLRCLKSFFKKVKSIVPYIWPKGNRILQLNIFICILLLAAGRVANLFVPIYNGYIVNSLSPKIHPDKGTFKYPKFRWDLILIWLGLKALQGGVAGTSGLLTNISNFLWLYVQQYTAKKVETEYFAHLHSLSMGWHHQRRTGAVLRSLDRGSDSITTVLQYILFNILPAIIDIAIAITYFTICYNVIFGLIIFCTLVLYIVLTVLTTKWRTRYNRTMNTADNQKNHKGVDGLLNFETVKHYGNEDFERQMYTEYMDVFQKEEVKFTAVMTAIDFVQICIVTAGFLAGTLLCAKMIVFHEGLRIGDYVLFSTYLAQLFQPLNDMGTYYKIVLRRIVDMENMLQIFDEVPEIQDYPGANNLVVTNGCIEFREVSFGYSPGKPVLSNVSFVIQPGTTAAFVGPSGGGKTSIIRLLLRLYDVNSGQVLIDGQNVAMVTQKSLRAAVGVVPQETVLFNDSVEYNVRYGSVLARDDEVIDAAKAACIHDRIKTFTKQYHTLVGDRGMKLSGGEKQRVSIARTILKNPPIILLDEATSSLDTETERQIQSSLHDLCRNRTCLIVAHRLSTIVNADVIHVLKNGMIRESGTHNELLELNGIYAGMWAAQMQSEDFGSTISETSM